MNFNKLSQLINLAVLFMLLSSRGDSIKHSKDAVANEIVKQGKDKIISPIDTVGFYKLGEVWIKPKNSFELNDPPRISGDTLFLVTCADYVYYPLGKIKAESDINASALNGFDVVEIVKNNGGDTVKYQKVSKAKNKMLLFFNYDDSPDAYWGSYIVKGEIKDNTLTLINGVNVDMSKNDFYSKFFETFDENLQSKIQVIALEPCISGNPTHMYYFKDGKLASILFNNEESTGSTVDY